MCGLDTREPSRQALLSAALQPTDPEPDLLAHLPLAVPSPQCFWAPVVRATEKLRAS